MSNLKGKGGFRDHPRNINRKGRDPKSRAMTEILERVGSSTVEREGKRISGKRLIAKLMWELATTGQVKFGDRVIKVTSAREWKDIVKEIYSQVDGPPRSGLDITSGGETIGQTFELDKLTDEELRTLEKIFERASEED